VRVGIFHNAYLWRGGEDAVVAHETELLRKAGVAVESFVVDNREAGLDSLAGRLRAGLQARRSPASARRVAGFLDAHPIDLAHVHNFFPLLTPAVHEELHARGIPVVQTLHNYRLFCANGAFLRAGRPCQDCVGAGPWNAVRHGCYRGSRVQTAVWAEATAHHRRRRTFERCVTLFVAPSAFARARLVEAGLDADRVVVKPNAVADPGEPRYGGRGAVYVGRLSEEKGPRLLLEAWRGMDGLPLAIVGTGPLEAELRARAAGIAGVRFTGQLPPEAVQDELRRALFLVAPSLCYESFPLAIAEAMAAGKAAVASQPSAMADWVEPGRTGLLFPSGDAGALARACRELAADPARTEAMGREARARYEDELSPERSLERLLAVYRQALQARGCPAARD
jgi:glycosyltransferase involved in cell wall biosynthesis